MMLRRIVFPVFLILGFVSYGNGGTSGYGIRNPISVIVISSTRPDDCQALQDLLAGRVVFSLDQTEAATQGFLRDLRERRADIDLGGYRDYCVRCHHQEEASLGISTLQFLLMLRGTAFAKELLTQLATRAEDEEAMADGPKILALFPPGLSAFYIHSVILDGGT